MPNDAVTALGSRKRPPVLVTIGDHTYRSTIAVYGVDWVEEAKRPATRNRPLWAPILTTPGGSGTLIDHWQSWRPDRP